MPTSRKVSLTTFVDFVSKSGTPKITAVRRFKRGDPYRPAFDFYKPVREAIVAVHKRGEPRKALDALVEGARDPRKIEPFRAIARGHAVGRSDGLVNAPGILVRWNARQNCDGGTRARIGRPSLSPSHEGAGLLTGAEG